MFPTNYLLSLMPGLYPLTKNLLNSKLEAEALFLVIVCWVRKLLSGCYYLFVYCFRSRINSFCEADLAISARFCL